MVVASDVGLRHARSRRVVALLDEPAHLATTWLLLSALAPRHTRAALVASTLLDADHVPSELGAGFLRRGAARPYGHTGAAIAAARLVGGNGAALGVAAHLVRDAADGTGVSLAWPLDGRAQRIPRAAYYAALLSAAARVARPTGAPRPPRPGP